MEYQRAYRDEAPRDDLVARHLRQVAPVLRERQLFAGVENFRLFPLSTPSGDIHDHVLAHSNGIGSRRSLVVFNNSDQPARGRLRHSAPFRSSTESPTGRLTSQEIHVALATADKGILVATDRLSGVRYLYDAAEVSRHGIDIELGGWECRVLEGFVPLAMPADVSRQLYERLGTLGVASLEALRRELEIEPLREILKRTLSAERLEPLLELPKGLSSLAAEAALVDELRRSLATLAPRAGSLAGEDTDRIEALIEMPSLARRLVKSDTRTDRTAGRRLGALVNDIPEMAAVLYCAIVLRELEALAPQPREGLEAIDWRLETAVLPRFVDAGGTLETARRLLSVLQLATTLGWGGRDCEAPSTKELARQLLGDEATRLVLGVNRFEGREYLSREALEALLDLRLALEALAWIDTVAEPAEIEAAVSDWAQVLDRLAADAEAAAYCTDRLDIIDVAEPRTDEE
jgi:hypothetical protein